MSIGIMDSSVNTPRLTPLVTEHLRFIRNGQAIIDDLDLRLEHGELSVVMGPNGAGKSVLLRLLHGLLRPTSGLIRWGNEPDPEKVRNEQAMVFQKPVLLRRSVAANVDFVLRLRGQPDRTRRDALLDRVGLLDQSQQFSHSLSGGEQQRLALARALATEPRLLFLDEPSASLDPASTLMIEQVVADTHRSGTKCVFVTHDIGQARRLADDVVFLNHGTVQEHSRASEFFSNPTSESATAYLEGRIVL